MKPFLPSIILIVLLFFGGKCFSQTATAVSYNFAMPQARATALTQSMASELRLTEVQKIMVKAINLEAYRDMDDAIKLSGYNTSQLEVEKNRIEETRNGKLRNNLTPKQWGCYKRLSKDHECIFGTNQGMSETEQGCTY